MRFTQPGEYKPTAFEIWIGNKLKSAFTAALAKAGVHPVYSMVEPLKKAIDENDCSGIADILKKCPRAAQAELEVLCNDPLRYALSKEKFGAADTLLAACPALLGATGYFGKTALLDFADKNQGDDLKTIHILQWLLEHRADIRDYDPYETSALHLAAARLKRDVAECLIGKGADVNARDKWGFTPLMVAAGQGNRDTMAMLLDRGAKMDAMTVNGFNAVTEAIRWSRFDAALWLIDRGAKINFAVPNLDAQFPKTQPARARSAAFLAAYEEQRKAWDSDRRDAEIEDSVRSIEGGVDKSVAVQHALRLKTGPGRFR
jgi:hypothetical protein